MAVELLLVSDEENDFFCAEDATEECEEATADWEEAAMEEEATMDEEAEACFPFTMKLSMLADNDFAATTSEEAAA